MIYLYDRSLIIDEANLARNIIEKDYIDFFSSLDYEQYAPPLFLCVEKLIVQLFGVSSLSLRFIPFLASIFSIVLFYKIIKEYIPSTFRFFPLIVFSLGLLVARYGTELKQYSTDVLIILGYLYAYLKYPINFKSYKNVFLWTISGVILIWASMPVIFILAAIGISTLVSDRGNLMSHFYFYSIITILWISSFALYYYQILQFDTSVDLLVEFHKNYFLSYNDWLGNFKIIQNLLNKIFGFTILTQLFIWIGILFSISTLKKYKDLGLFILFLFLVTFIASFISKFTLIPRVALFLVPVIILCVSIGLSNLFEILKNRNDLKLKAHTLRLYSLPIIFCMALSIINLPKLGPFQYKSEFENTKATISFVEKNISHKKLIIDHLVFPSYHFYTELIKNPIGQNIQSIEMRDWDNDLLDLINTESNEEFYFWYTTIDENRLKNILFESKKYYTISNISSFENNHLLKFSAKSK